MQEQDFPALYRSADDLSLRSQENFLRALRVHLVTLVLTAILSIINCGHWLVAVFQLVFLLTALGSSIYLFSKKPDKYWYAGRAVAESIKTITWRYVSRAEPFQGDDAQARQDFEQKIRDIINQNKAVVELLSKFLDGVQITPGMDDIRAKKLIDRRELYAANRIADQHTWYANKTVQNRKKSRDFFIGLIGVNCLAVLFAIFRIQFPDQSFWPTDIFVAIAASILTWMQTKRFSELASSYALAAHEISLIRGKTNSQDTEAKFSVFVGDAENAFSREHTQWVARQDI